MASKSSAMSADTAAAGSAAGTGDFCPIFPVDSGSTSEYPSGGVLSYVRWFAFFFFLVI